MTATFDVPFEVRTRGSGLWLYLVATPAHWLFGERIAKRVAVFGLQRIIVYRMLGRRKWQRFPREVFSAILDDRTVDV